jgi:hypothetical protein
MTATAKRVLKQPDRTKSGQERNKPNKVITFRKASETTKPIWERSESFRFGLLVGRYLRLESDRSFNFHLQQQVLTHCDEADFASGFRQGLLSK